LTNGATQEDLQHVYRIYTHTTLLKYCCADEGRRMVQMSEIKEGAVEEYEKEDVDDDSCSWDITITSLPSPPFTSIDDTASHFCKVDTISRRRGINPLKSRSREDRTTRSH
jgi:hypothetical protein